MLIYSLKRREVKRSEKKHLERWKAKKRDQNVRLLSYKDHNQEERLFVGFLCRLSLHEEHDLELVFARIIIKWSVALRQRLSSQLHELWLFLAILVDEEESAAANEGQKTNSHLNHKQLQGSTAGD